MRLGFVSTAEHLFVKRAHYPIYLGALVATAAKRWETPPIASTVWRRWLLSNAKRGSVQLVSVCDWRCILLVQQVTEAYHSIRAQRPLPQELEQLGTGNDRVSRSLRGTIEMGQAGRCLESALESWLNWYRQTTRAKRSLVAGLVYPVLLVIIAIGSLTFTAWQLIPEYDSAFDLLGTGDPQGFAWIRWLHQNLIAFSLTLVVFMIVIPGWWLARNLSSSSNHPPHNAASLHFLQAHLARLAASAIPSGRPVGLLVSDLMAAAGLPSRSATGQSSETAVNGQSAMNLLDEPRVQQTIGREALLTLVSLDTRIMSTAECENLLALIAQQLTERAEMESTRQNQWLPVLVSLSVGFILALTYVFVIVVPWVTLFQQIGRG